MTWKNIIRKGMIKGYKDYKMYFSFFDGETLPFGSVIEYTGSKEIVIPLTRKTNNRSQARLENGKRYTIRGAVDPSFSSGGNRDYGLLAESDGVTVILQRRLMMEEGRNFKVISRGSEEQGNISVPPKK